MAADCVLALDQGTTSSRAIARASVEPAQIAAVGIANQRETALVWERGAGTPVANAIGWQSRITASDCEQLRQLGPRSTLRAAGR